MGTVTPSLVVLAGGLGSRFGGDKQLVGVGPGGEAFLDYAIRDALAAGVERIVLVARSDIHDLLEAHLLHQHGPSAGVAIVHQDSFGPPRDKPWGTGHALLAAAEVLEGPVVVMNADDHYGPTGVGTVVEALVERRCERAVLLAFELAVTLSASGPVSRGVCTVEDGRLAGLVETHGIRRDGGVIRSARPEGTLAADTPVSMNLWGLPGRVLEGLAGQWRAFHAEHGSDPSAEFLLPVAVEEQRAAGRIGVDVLRSREKWIGITNRDDLELARREFPPVDPQGS